MPLISNYILLPSSFAFPYCFYIASFAGLFWGDLEFGYFYWELINVNILSKVFNTYTYSEMTINLGI